MARAQSATGGTGVNARSPYQALNPSICLPGIFPSRN
jgi:microcystin-dependent protein